VSSPQVLQAFVRALQAVVARHDILRTAILWEDLPKPVQVVCRHAVVSVEELALSPNSDPVEQLKETMRLGPHRLDLRQAPLMRLQVVTDLGGGECYALLQTHHLVCDNESVKVLISDVLACVAGRGHELPVSAQYRDHVAQALEQARTQDAEGFFRGKLSDIDEPTAPFGLIDVYADGSRTREFRRSLGRPLAQQVRSHARRLGVSAATLFHAAWGLVVSHTSGRNDVVFGTVLLGRLQDGAAMQRALGMFINTLPLRLRLKEVSVHELVKQAHRELAELVTYEQASLTVAQRASGVKGSAPLFTALLNYRHTAVDSEAQWTAGGGIHLLAELERTNYPIMVSVDDAGDAFTLTAQTDQRVDPERMLGYLETALQSLTGALEHAQPIPALSVSILPQTERQQILERFNATDASFPGEKLIHDLFDEQAQRSPETVALVHEQRSVTYGELHRKANQLARYLRTQGLETGDLVGLCLERGLDMVVGLLGILKAGAAYIPLDPAYPAERLLHMLEDARPRLLLTQETVRPELPSTPALVIALDSDWTAIAAAGNATPEPHAIAQTPRDLAYVIYTSGSTGKPKGVMIEHAGVVNFLTSMQKAPGIDATDRMLAVTTVSFDIAALEIFGSLLSGATLILASREDATDADRLMALLDQHDATLMQATPATWQLLLGAGWPGRPRLKALCGGEALTTTLSRALLERVSSLWNLYGPTETTIWSCVRQVAVSCADGGAVEPIGRPIANTRIYVLDSSQHPVPLGVPGEIYIGGAGVARGYLNRPELSAERFSADPFTADSAARLYKTGDLGQWRPDGTLEYLGRNDHQVKVRGYRIELGEIEARLAQHEAVQAAVVIAREDVPGEKQLVAYLKVTGEDRPGVDTLRAHLRATLPEFMLPGAFVMLDRFPLTPNGKLDRRALPAPDTAAQPHRHYEPPQGEVEVALAQIWQEVLRVPRIGRQDNFFDLGGHSLLAMQTMIRVRSALSVALPFRQLFEAATVEQLAARVAASRQSRLREKLAAGGEETRALLAKVAAMPASQIQTLMRQLRAGARP